MSCPELGNIGAGASSNDVVISYSCQDTYDTKSTGVYKQVSLTSADFKSTEESTTSAELRSDRQGGNAIRTALNAGGTLNFELKKDSYDDFMSLAAFDKWYDIVELDLSDLDFSGNDITTTAGDFSNFVVGKNLYINGSNLNDGKYTIETVTTTVITVKEDLTAESGTANVLASSTAYLADAGDIEFVALDKSINSTVLDFTTLDLLENQSILIGGSVSNNERFRIKTITANKIEVYEDVVDETPVGQVTIMGSRLRNGVRKQAITIEEKKVENEYFDYVGSMVNTMDISWATGSVINGSFEFISKSEEINTSTAASKLLPVDNTIIYDAVTNLSTVYIDEAVAEAAATEVTFNVNNNLSYQPQIGSIESAGTTIGNCDTTGSVTMYYNNGDIYKDFLALQKKFIIMPQIVDGAGYAFSINAKLTDPSKEVPGVNETCMQSYQLTAEADEDINFKFEISRF